MRRFILLSAGCAAIAGLHPRNAIAQSSRPVVKDSAYFSARIDAAMKTGNAPGLLDVERQAVAKYPANLRFLDAYASDLLKQQHVSDAMAIARRIIAINPHDDMGFYVLFTAFTDMGHSDSVFAFARAAVKKTPDLVGDLANPVSLAIAPTATLAVTSSTKPAQLANWLKVRSLADTAESIAPGDLTRSYRLIADQSAAELLAGIERGSATSKAMCDTLRRASTLLDDANPIIRSRVWDSTAGSETVYHRQARLAGAIKLRKDDLGC